MRTVSVVTLGCKVNQFESEALEGSLEKHGYVLVPFGEAADITVINTCTVTHRADFQSRQMIRRASRLNPGSLIIVTGCYSQVNPEAISRIEGVRYVLGNKEKSRIIDLLPRMIRGESPKVQVSDIQEEKAFSGVSLPEFHHHTRAFLKIEDGCDNRCSYCIVPRARGAARSLPPESVLKNLKVLTANGFKEAVLTGIHVGCYGRDLDPPLTLEKLLRRLETEETPKRLRLSSIEPLDFSRDLLSFLKSSKKICPHLHIPIQSGDDETLSGMNRGYDHHFISDLVQRLHRDLPDASIGADIIAGFPGETERGFENTYQLIESLPIAYLHVFPFSKRENTPASRYPRQVGDRAIKGRAERLRELGRRKRLAFYQRFLFRELDVLGEARMDRATGKWKGLSRNYIPFISENGSDWINREWRVRVTHVEEKGVTGEVIGEIFHDGCVTPAYRRHGAGRITITDGRRSSDR